jgi:5-methyltetrahydrofolate--homocysteine methyltransferase
MRLAMKKESWMPEKLFEAITSLSKDEALRITDEMLQSNSKPEEILDISRTAMQDIGDRFEAGDCFLPELIVSGDILAGIADKVKPYLEGSGSGEKIGKIVFGTVEGDIHDIAKDIVVSMLDVNGFEVIDLGVDVPAEKFVEAVLEHQAEIVGLSGFLTLAIQPMKQTISALKQAEVSNVKVMIGGGPINEMVCQATGADAWGANAMDAVNIAKEWAGGGV